MVLIICDINQELPRLKKREKKKRKNSKGPSGEMQVKAPSIENSFKIYVSERKKRGNK